MASPSEKLSSLPVVAGDQKSLCEASLPSRSFLVRSSNLEELQNLLNSCDVTKSFSIVQRGEFAAVSVASGSLDTSVSDSVQPFQAQNQALASQVSKGTVIFSDPAHTDKQVELDQKWRQRTTERTLAKLESRYGQIGEEAKEDLRSVLDKALRDANPSGGRHVASMRAVFESATTLLSSNLDALNNAHPEAGIAVPQFQDFGGDRSAYLLALLVANQRMSQLPLR